MSAYHYRNAHLTSTLLCCFLITACDGGSGTNSTLNTGSQNSAAQTMGEVQAQFDSLSTTTTTISTGEIVLDIPNTNEFELVPFSVSRIEIESVQDESGTILLSTLTPFRVTVFIDDLVELDNEANGVRAIFQLENPAMDALQSLESAFHTIEGSGSTSFSVFCRASIDDTQRLLATCASDLRSAGISYPSAEFLHVDDLSNLLLSIEFTYGPDFPQGNSEVNRFGVYRTSVPISIVNN